MKQAILYLRTKYKRTGAATKSLNYQEYFLRDCCAKYNVEIVKVYMETFKTISEGNTVFYQALREVSRGEVKAKIFFVHSLDVIHNTGLEEICTQDTLLRGGLRMATIRTADYDLKQIENWLKK